MNMLYTSRRSKFRANLMSEYMNTTNKCIELFYWIESNSRTSTLTITTVSEELKQTQVAIVSLVIGDWRRMLFTLPDGINRVVIEGKRDPSGGCQISIDDVMIQNCEQFGKIYVII